MLLCHHVVNTVYCLLEKFNLLQQTSQSDGLVEHVALLDTFFIRYPVQFYHELEKPEY